MSSADIHDEHEDNYEAAYSSAPSDAPVIPATPAHGFWKTLKELEGTAKLQTEKGNNEFPAGLVGGDAPVNPLHRRNFFQLMGASMALAGVGACRYEKEEIVPLARRPEGQVPGQAQHYATAMELGGVAYPLLATSYEGRPIGVNGNPFHPFASGNVVTGTQTHAGTTSFALASVLNMYDPDRSQNVLKAGAGSSLEQFLSQLRAQTPQQAGAIRILSEASSSPTIAALRQRLAAKYPALQWHEYEPISHDSERLGMRLAFGRVVRPLPLLDKAQTVVSLDADFLCDHPAGLRLSRDFARARRVDGWLTDANGKSVMNRLYAIESALSNTGAMADHRLGVRSEHCFVIALALDAMLSGGSMPSSELLGEAKVKRFLEVLVEELRENRGRAVVIAGRKQPAEVHALVARINEALQAPIEYYADPDPERPAHLASIQSLVADMKSGAVQNLYILGGNPVYDAPADLDFAGALAKVGNSVHLSEMVNETSQKTSWHLPKAHYLEAWGDSRTWDGTITLSQPIIAPLYGGISSAELLAMLLGEETKGEALTRATHDALGLTTTWRQSVHDGFIAGTAAPIANARTTQFPVPAMSGSQAKGGRRGNNEIEVTFQTSPFSYDGRYANNAWLQETPDFLTKVTWDNYAIVGPETATVLKLDNDTMITVKIGDRSLTLPCYVLPGQARYSVALVLGGGRTAAGRVGGQGKRSVGWDTYKVRTTAGFDIALSASISSTGDAYELASVQEHWDIRKDLIKGVTQDGIAERLPELVKTTTFAEFESKPTWTAESQHQPYWNDEHVDTGGPKRGLSLFREHEYTSHKWGMAIDLTTCTGCNSCMVACQSENNVPVVGREEVKNNREMHWIRIDRYFSGTPEEPIVVHQPLTCQQCENAPCEQVCPVGATVHSSEGLNDMAYNRCIGTRYCANNCPYKVRRFNFLDWNKEWREARNKVRRLLFNPEVTVRMRGVMEKCTFCVQRIQNAKIHARAQIRNGQRAGDINRPLVDGEVTTACQQACPSEAITFGDLADPTSRVSKLHADRRAYDLLPETYTKPRNQYLARVRNPNPKLEPPKAADAHGGGHGDAPAAAHGEHH